MKESFEAVLDDKQSTEILPENKPEDVSVSKKEITPERLAEITEKGQKMIDSYSKFFATFARDVSLKFVLSNGYYINFKKGEIHLNAMDFAENDMNMDQVLWSAMHELAHFIDLTDDPDGLLGNFEHIKSKTKVLSKKVLDKLLSSGVIEAETAEKLSTRPEPDEDGEESLTRIEQSLYRIFHSFYNCLDDVYVNNLVSRKAPKFEKRRPGGKEIYDLYKEKLFKDKDYRKIPRHMQFMFTLIRKEMVPDDEIDLSPDVLEVFEREIQFEGQSHTVKDIISKFIIPKSGRDTTSTRRNKVIRKTIEPIFEELLQKDLDDWDPKQQNQDKGEGEKSEEGGGDNENNNESKDSGENEDEDSKEGKGKKPSKKDPNSDEFDPNPFDSAYDKFKKGIPDRLTEKDIKKFIKVAKEKEKEKKNKEEQVNQSVETQSQFSQEAMDKEWAKKNNVDMETLAEFRRIENEVAPYLEELSVLWRDIVYGSTKEISVGVETGHKTGELNIGQVIEQWPQIEKHQFDDVRVMDKRVERSSTVLKPELIRVRIVGDVSGSMFQDSVYNTTEDKYEDSPKIKILKQAVVLLLSSLKEFNTYLNLTRATTKSKLEVDTEAWIFGNYPVKVKKSRSETGIEEEQARIVETVAHLNTNLSNTYDNLALQQIRESLTPEEISRIKDKKILEIVFEITDGVPNLPDHTKNEIESLDELGAIIRGFQIGEVYDDYRETFDKVWNQNGEVRGEVVGSSIQNLIPAITSALKKYLKNVRL